MAVDEGYAWIVAFGCFVISFIMAGLARAAGVLYRAIIDVYGCSREAATAPFSIRFSLRQLSGPLVGYLGQRYGIRPVAAVGGLLAGIGGMFCVFAPNVTWITVMWGVVHGFGYGLCNLIHVMIINDYFDKYRGTAIGLVLSGDCIGTFVFPSVLEYLLYNYGLNGTFLILGGVALNVVPAALLLRPPDWLKTSSKHSKVQNVDCTETLDMKKYAPSSPARSISEKNLEYIYPQIHPENIFVVDASNAKPESFLNPYAVVVPNVFDVDKKDAEKYYDASHLRTANQNKSSYDCIHSNLENHKNNSTVSLGTTLASPYSSNNILVKPTPRHPLLQLLITNTRPMFMIIAFNLATYVFLFIAVITIIIDYAADVGIPSELRNYLIISFSVTDLIGRLAFGAVLDKKWVRASHFAGLVSAVVGLTTFIVPLCGHFYYVMACMSVNGLAQGGCSIIYPILVDQYMDKNEGTLAMGCLNFYGGLLLLSLASMIGYFRDVTYSYDGVFYIVGSLCVVAGLLWLLEPLIVRKKNTKNEPKSVLT